MMWLVWSTLAFAQSEPTDHTLIYYNARMAMREGNALEAVKLWLLRNALESDTEEVSSRDGDFHSVTWAALGKLGVCQDGYAPDTDGAGLWPLGLHNWVVRNRSQRVPPKRPRPFKAFDVGRQQRFVSIGDVLGSRELKTLDLFRGRCLRHRVAMYEAGILPNAKLSDRQVAVRLLLHLLRQSDRTLAEEGIRGRAVIEARKFDIYLQMAALAEREARRKAREQAREGRFLGLGRPSVAAMRSEAPRYTFVDGSPPAVILKESLTWSVEEWMRLSPDRRLFVFDHAQGYLGRSAELDALGLGIIDALIDRREGAELEKWIGFRVPEGDAEAAELLWGGERGLRLMALDDESGFRERAVVALHRGVQHLESGELPEALRAMAYALQYAPESRRGDVVQSLSLRWMSYIASQFSISDELLITLQELVPRREYSVLLEDLMWRAAFHADDASFQRGLDNQVGRGALERRLELLKPLAKGRLGDFSNQLRRRLNTSPGEVTRFLDTLVQRLEREDEDIRAMQVPTLIQIRDLLEPLARGEDNGRQGRKAGELSARCQSILEGLGALGDTTAGDRARSLSPNGEVFAGSIRVAPSDALPWPFAPADVPAPSVFTQLELVPIEWRDPETNALVFGWSIGG